jgi:hypothetical protein
MLIEVRSEKARLAPQDVLSYVGMENVAEVLEQGNVLEYWKSAPYLLNFMDEYKIKQQFEEAVDDESKNPQLAKALAKAKDQMLLTRKDVEEYKQVDPGNARLRDLLAGTIESGAWQLLWIPPTFPYYQLQGPFADPGLRKFTKRLVFSSWRVVPKAIATLLSYEAERRMILSFEPKARNTAEARKRRAPLLRFARSEGRLTGMPVLGLIYPCSTLAAECDPLTLIAGETASNLLPTIEAVLDRFRGKIEGLLKEIKLPVADEGSSDDWYWAAPILLDLINHREETVKWFEPDNLAAIWAGIDETGNGDRTQPDADGEVGRWGEHVEQARNLVNRFCEGTLSLGPMPADLPTVLANMAIGGLGVVALRSVFRVTHGEGMLVNADLRDAGAQIARAFLTLFNTPESMSLIRGMNAAEPYWERVMQYCVHGGLQSVLDEYAHVLRESLGLIDKPVEVVSSEITSAIHDALALRTSSMTVDSVQVKEDIPQVKMGQFEMRGRFALRFDRDKAEGSPEDTRPQQVRAAFNSPFWPFVLATTSVGQEGLDFHHYCHAVVHWNLPSNPVDLEQREGRVHRYKGHAVRKNLADRHGISTLSKGVRDPWESLFLAGECHRPEDATDLVPYWVYPIEGGARIERHVPALPLSREVERMSALRRSLKGYRMVFGQNRQEDLVNYLLSRVPKTEIESLTQELRVDLSPPTV